ncbi:hypothetical protein [Bordetella ansorpii]|uniref:hypothetical protein n=1 Tax=Bordetella ansorpii TaxID=288768 RepID=UPI0012E933E2|nr:hypothetical protein [Bordetella ansorpii]
MIILPAMLAGCSSPSEILAKRIQESLGDDFQQYQVLSYPTNNFGVATSYRFDGSASYKVTDADFICATWKCVGVEMSSAQPKDFDGLMRVRANRVEYAEIGVGGEINLKSDESSNYGLEVLLPKISGVLNLGIALDSKNVTSVDMKLGPAIKRMLSKPAFDAYLRKSSNSPTHQRLQSLYSQGALAVVVGDVVIQSIEARVTTLSEVAAKIDAQLGGLPSKVFSDASTSFQVQKSGTATYTVKTVEPVIALRLLKKQPGAQELSDGQWSAWLTGGGASDPTLPESTQGKN